MSAGDRHHGGKDIARQPPKHDAGVRAFVGDHDSAPEARDEITQPDTTSPDELLQDLKLGKVEELAAADDNSVISVRSMYKDWSDDVRQEMNNEHLRVYDAIVHELSQRGLTGG